MKKVSLVLGSQSPRRAQLLSLLDLPFRVYTEEGVIEELAEQPPIALRAEAIARKKAEQLYHALQPGELLITADTLVIVDDTPLGKPTSREEAIEMLSQISGRTHSVTTGVALSWEEHTESFSCTTQVTFAPLSEKEILYYVDKYQPFDKAGAYGIQEWIGAVGISHMEGSFYNVMGLPVHRLYQALKPWIE